MDVQLGGLEGYLLLMVTGLLGYWCYSSFLRPCGSKNTPPGPRGWDVIKLHYRLARGEALHDIVSELTAKHGELVFTYVAGRPMLFLSDYIVAREMLNSEKCRSLCAVREATSAVGLMFWGDKSVQFGEYTAKKRSQRTMLAKCLAECGLLSENYAKLMDEELTRLLQQLADTNEADIRLDRMLVCSLQRSTFLLLTGKQPESEALIEEITDMGFTIAKSNSPFVMALSSKISLLPYLPPFRARVEKGRQARDTILRILSDATEKSETDDGTPLGMFYTMKRLMNDEQFKWMDETDFKAQIISAISASQVTTRVSTVAIMLNLAFHPDVQRKIQAEIDQLTDGRRRANTDDRILMPYTEATILENFRLMSVNPFVNRDAAEDFEFRGYTIPKYTIIQLNNWEISHTPKTFDDPWSFKPERYLDEFGHLLARDHPSRLSNVPFGLGLRRCPAEALALNRMFNYLTSILQQFDVLPPKDDQLPSADPRTFEAGLAMSPPGFSCRVVRRIKT